MRRLGVLLLGQMIEKNSLYVDIILDTIIQFRILATYFLRKIHLPSSGV